MAEMQGVNLQGGTSATVSVGGRVSLGTPMEACEKACAPVLSKLGIGDAVRGTSGALTPAVPVPVPVMPRDSVDRISE